MSEVYNSIMAGLSEAVDDTRRPKLQRRVVTIAPVKIYSSAEIKRIRQKTGMSQKLFAGYMGVSVKWRRGKEAEIILPVRPADFSPCWRRTRS